MQVVTNIIKIGKIGNMKRIFTFLLIAFLLFSCKTQENIGEITFGTSSMQNLYEMTITQHQIDSICEADMLPNYTEWLKARFTDYETNTVFVKRMYFKSCSDENEVIYILIGESEPYKITKRIAE